MQATMRKIGALCQKDFIDMFKNPSMLVWAKTQMRQELQ